MKIIQATNHPRDGLLEALSIPAKYLLVNQMRTLDDLKYKDSHLASRDRAEAEDSADRGLISSTQCW